jgi:hypothetical protein
MAKPAATLADQIAAALPPRAKTRPWWDRIDPAHLAELEPVRARFLAGGYDASKRQMARTISAHLRAAGIADVGEQGVISWLNAAK